MSFFTKKILQELKEREDEIVQSSAKCLQTNSIADISSHLGGCSEATKKPAAVAVA